MSLWILDGDVGGMDRSVLVDSVTERPYSVPAFESHEAVESFLALFHKRVGLPNLGRHGHAAASAALDAVHAEWVALPKCQQCGERVVTPGELANECEGCRPCCEWKDGCDERGTDVMKTGIMLDRYCPAHAARMREAATTTSRETSR